MWWMLASRANYVAVGRELKWNYGGDAPRRSDMGRIDLLGKSKRMIDPTTAAPDALIEWCCLRLASFRV